MSNIEILESIKSEKFEPQRYGKRKLHLPKQLLRFLDATIERNLIPELPTYQDLARDLELVNANVWDKSDRLGQLNLMINPTIYELLAVFGTYNKNRIYTWKFERKTLNYLLDKELQGKYGAILGIHYDSGRKTTKPFDPQEAAKGFADKVKKFAGEEKWPEAAMLLYFLWKLAQDFPEINGHHEDLKGLNEEAFPEMEKVWNSLEMKQDQQKQLAEFLAPLRPRAPPEGSVKERPSIAAPPPAMGVPQRRLFAQHFLGAAVAEDESTALEKLFRPQSGLSPAETMGESRHQRLVVAEVT